MIVNIIYKLVQMTKFDCLKEWANNIKRVKVEIVPVLPSHGLQGLPKCWYPTTSLHGITTQKATT
jgi:hypothetical protein